MAEPFKHIYKVDLNQPLKRFDVGDILASGDEKANSFEVTVCRDGANVDLAGCTVYGYFIRPNEETMNVNGTVNGSKAIVALSKSCYVYDGAFSFAIKITGNGITQTVAVFDGRIVRTASENIVDGDRVIYGLEDLLAQIAATEAAANSANTAAANANTATSNANTATNNANTAASAANTAANRANNAAQNWENGTAANSSKLGGKAPEYYIQPRNLLDNSDFTNPVNQRGIVSGNSVASGAYFIDRWYYIGESAGEFTLSEKGLGFTVGATIVQRVGSNIKSGTPLTFAVCMDDGTVFVANATVTYQADGSWLRLISTAEGIFIDTYGGNVEAIVYAMNERTVKWVALYEGSYTAETLPPYVPKPYAVELAECQRYYRRTGAGTGYSIFGFGHASSTVEILMYVPKGQMRIEAPTFSAFVPKGAFQAYNPAGSVDITSLSADQYSGSYWRVKATVAGATSGEFYYLRAKNDLNAYIEENADL